MVEIPKAQPCVNEPHYRLHTPDWKLLSECMSIVQAGEENHAKGTLTLTITTNTNVSICTLTNQN